MEKASKFLKGLKNRFSLAEKARPCFVKSGSCRGKSYPKKKRLFLDA